MDNPLDSIKELSSFNFSDKRKSQITIVVFWMVIIFIAIIVSLNLDFVNKFIQKYISEYGYFALPVFGFLAEVFEQPIGGEVSASLGVIYGLNLFIVLLLVISASFMASSLNFFIGRKYLSYRILNACSKERQDKFCNLFYKYGKLELFLGALTPVPWVSSCLLSGAFKMKFKDFFYYGLFPRACRIFIIATITWYVWHLV